MLLLTAVTSQDKDMKQFVIINWAAMVQKLASDRQMSMRQLAADLGCSQQFLSEVAGGKKPPGIGLRLKILSAVGYDGPRDELLELLFNEDEAASILEWERERGQRRANKKAEKQERVDQKKR